MQSYTHTYTNTSLSSLSRSHDCSLSSAHNTDTRHGHAYHALTDIVLSSHAYVLRLCKYGIRSLSGENVTSQSATVAPVLDMHVGCIQRSHNAITEPFVPASVVIRGKVRLLEPRVSWVCCSLARGSIVQCMASGRPVVTTVWTALIVWYSTSRRAVI